MLNQTRWIKKCENRRHAVADLMLPSRDPEGNLRMCFWERSAKGRPWFGGVLSALSWASACLCCLQPVVCADPKAKARHLSRMRGASAALRRRRASSAPWQFLSENSRYWQQTIFCPWEVLTRQTQPLLSSHLRASLHMSLPAYAPSYRMKPCKVRRTISEVTGARQDAP